MWFFYKESAKQWRSSNILRAFDPEIVWLYSRTKNPAAHQNAISALRKKKVILSLSLWTHQTFKGFLSVVQRWTEFICSVRDTHLNPVWMKVNTFTLVTTVCIKTEKQLGPGRQVQRCANTCLVSFAHSKPPVLKCHFLIRTIKRVHKIVMYMCDETRERQQNQTVCLESTKSALIAVLLTLSGTSSHTDTCHSSLRAVNSQETALSPSLSLFLKSLLQKDDKHRQFNKKTLNKACLPLSSMAF